MELGRPLSHMPHPVLPHIRFVAGVPSTQDHPLRSVDEVLLAPIQEREGTSPSAISINLVPVVTGAVVCELVRRWAPAP